MRDIKRTFHAKMGTIKNRNGMDLTEAEDIKERQEYTEELYKKDLHDQDNHDGVITHLEPDILECNVKWALGSSPMNKASGVDGIPVELFQILKEDVLRVVVSPLYSGESGEGPEGADLVEARTAVENRWPFWFSLLLNHVFFIFIWPKGKAPQEQRGVTIS